MALVIYQDPSRNHYIESHGIQMDKEGRGRLLAGKPLHINTIKAIVSRFASDAVRHGLLPANVLAIGPKSMIWYIPSKIKNLVFDTSAGIPSGRAPTPGLVFSLTESSFNVFAFRGSKRPSGKTALFHAPFPNINRSGSICMGNAKIQRVDDAARQIALAEKAFFSSAFTHTIMEKGQLQTLSVPELWKGLMNAPRAIFPKHELVRHQEMKSVQSLIQRANL